jgi:hypothetical protein
VPERAHLHSAGEARELLDALREFCTWAERVHDVPLAEAFEKHVARVRDSLPRIVEANRACEPDAGGEQGALFEWLGGGDGRGLVRDRAGQEHEVRVVAALAAQLRAGDRLRAQRDDGELHVYCCYPAESAALERELA